MIDTSHLSSYTSLAGVGLYLTEENCTWRRIPALTPICPHVNDIVPVTCREEHTTSTVCVASGLQTRGKDALMIRH